ncbi:flagellar basal body-associated protein [Mizugakiibacter sediminis]|uniref:Flagellar protein FliL n=1 Tax=Mizugakiibacter sediminis TaxID=1475481 RepID=A0A0K8QPS6_9GAMM|nr:flagellar basal body-associated FliL family protein [Mizugakiibacter sediminis]GAP66676.1 flagellar basal body-associated protein [Mizugakiibacter sediminis]
MAAVEDSIEVAAEAEAPPAKRGRLLLIVGVLVVLLAGAGAGAWFAFGRAPAAQGKAAAAKPVAEPHYLALDPPFIVNFRDDDALRFLQVGVEVMARDQAALDTLKAEEPVARNALVLLFSSQDYKTLSSRDGKEKLRAEALTELQKIVRQRSGKPGLEAVYFTSFVMQ